MIEEDRTIIIPLTEELERKLDLVKASINKDEDTKYWGYPEILVEAFESKFARQVALVENEIMTVLLKEISDKLGMDMKIVDEDVFDSVKDVRDEHPKD